MKKIILALLVVSLFSCNQEKEVKKTETNNPSNSNVLLYNKAVVKQEVNLFPDMNQEWVESLTNSGIISKIREGAKSGKTVYDYNSNEKLSMIEVIGSILYIVDTVVIEQMNGDIETKIIKTEYPEDQFKALFFEENWSVDEDMTSFNKDLVKYTLIREVIDPQAKLEGLTTKDTMRYITISIVNNHDDENFKPLAQNIKSEFYFKQDIPSFVKGFNEENLTKALLNSVLSGKKKAYSFDDLNTVLTVDEIKQSIGATTDTMIVENEDASMDTVIVQNEADPESIIGLIFIEDWFYNENTMVIEKKVTAMAPIWFNVIITSDGQSYETKQIPFLIKFDEE